LGGAPAVERLPCQPPCQQARRKTREVATMTAEHAATTDRAHEPTVLVSAASRHGATAEIARAIGQALSEQGLTVRVIPPGDVRSLDGYDAVIIGSAVYMGHWLDPAKDLVNRFHEALTNRPVWLFSSGPVGKPSGKLARSMDQDPADLPGVLQATHARDHRRWQARPEGSDRSPAGIAAGVPRPGWRLPRLGRHPALGRGDRPAACAGATVKTAVRRRSRTRATPPWDRRGNRQRDRAGPPRRAGQLGG
jgi:menaquinone-dependent protoporphyrinogen oxidase